VVRITPISKPLPFRPFGRGRITPFRGLTITMVINHLLTGMSGGPLPKPFGTPRLLMAKPP